MPPLNSNSHVKGIAMPQKAPWHSVKDTDRKVHHDNTLCTEGNNIEAKYLRQGTAGRPRCDHCARLNQQGR